MTVDIKTEQSVPTNDFINVNVDAVAKVRISPTPEGIRLAATLPAWSVYSPIGHLVAKMLLACGLSEAELRLLHTWIWTIHGISSLAFIAAVPLLITRTSTAHPQALHP